MVSSPDVRRSYVPTRDLLSVHVCKHLVASFPGFTLVLRPTSFYVAIGLSTRVKPGNEATGGPTDNARPRTKNLNSKLSNIQHYAVYMCCIPSISPPSAARCALGLANARKWSGLFQSFSSTQSPICAAPRMYILITATCIAAKILQLAEQFWYRQGYRPPFALV